MGVFFITLIIAVVLYNVGFFDPKAAGLAVYATPESDVYVNNERAGRTPYVGILPPGRISLRIIVDEGEIYATELGLVSGVETVVSRRLFEGKTGGYVASYRSSGKNKPALSVTTDPLGATVIVNRSEAREAPVMFDNLSLGTHTVVVTKRGFMDETIEISAETGHVLELNVKLLPVVSDERDEFDELKESDSF